LRQRESLAARFSLSIYHHSPLQLFFLHLLNYRPT